MATQTTSNGKLTGKRIAILATDGFEQSELEKPRRAFEEAGAETVIVSLEKKDIQGMNHDEKGDRFAVGLVVSEARESDFDALLLPGGVKNPDTLRTDEGAVAFVKAFATAGKPITAICHGPWTLVEADVLQGRKVTSYDSNKTDLRNAGATSASCRISTISRSSLPASGPGASATAGRCCAPCSATRPPASARPSSSRTARMCRTR